MAQKDYYKLLGVNKSSSDDEIKKAFRSLAHKYHPDKQGGDTVKFKEINEAYQVLSDKTKRQQYDQFGSDFVNQAGAGTGGPFGGFKGQGFEYNFGNTEDLGDLFGGMGEMFGFGSGGRGRAKQQRGEDIAVDVELTLKEACLGTQKKFSLHKPAACEMCSGTGAASGSKKTSCRHCGGKGQVTRTQNTILGSFQTVTACPECHGVGEVPEKPCNTCHGTGAHKRTEELTVNIPAGIDDSQQIRITSRGAAAPFGGRIGDLYVRVHVAPDKNLERDGLNIYSEVIVSYPTAVLGGQARTYTLEGDVTIKIPEGILSGELIRLRGKGAGLEGRRGDHFVRVIIDVPKKVSRGARRLLEELRDELA